MWKSAPAPSRKGQPYIARPQSRGHLASPDSSVPAPRHSASGMPKGRSRADHRTRGKPSRTGGTMPQPRRRRSACESRVGRAPAVWRPPLVSPRSGLDAHRDRRLAGTSAGPPRRAASAPGVRRDALDEPARQGCSRNPSSLRPFRSAIFACWSRPADRRRRGGVG